MKENRTIDYRFKILYAAAMLSVVCDHTMGGGLAFVSDWFLYGGLPLPLFVFCSGYFYKDSAEEHPGKYLLKKARTLLVPLYLYTFVYGLIVQLLRLKGFEMGEDLTLHNLLIAPLNDGHQFVYNMAGWFIAPLFMTEVWNLLVRKAVKLFCRTAPEAVFFAIGVISGLAGIQLAILGYHSGWWLALVRMLYFVPFYSLGVFYHRTLETYERNIPTAWVIGINFAAKLAIIWHCGKNIRYTIAWCNDFTEGPVLPILLGFLGIALWIRIAALLEPVIGRSRWINLIADSTYSIMMNQFMGFMIVKTVFALLSKVHPAYADFNWTGYKTDIWWYYVPKGVLYTLIIYAFAGIAFPILVQKLIYTAKKKMTPRE